MFWNPQDPPRRARSAALVLQAILAVSEVTSGAASTGVANFEAVPEVTHTKPFQLGVGSASAKASSLMRLLIGLVLRNAIDMTYSNVAPFL